MEAASSTVFFNKYFKLIEKKLSSVDLFKLIRIADIVTKAHKSGNKIIIVGNGGSASIADHLTIDFVNAAKIRAINFNDPALITCFSNDYGYKNWVSRAIESYANSGDIAILISSSGQSENMLIGARKAKSMDVDVVTLTGFLYDNPLKAMGDINLWVDNKQYNIVEMTHHIWLLAIVDYIIEMNKE
jgi:D-sedoheptulose 7-phosphate isomerase